MTKSFLTLWAALGCAWFVGGCAAVSHELGWDVEPRYVELTEQQPEDIPVPDGFRMVTKTKESYSIDLGPDGFRDAHLVYIGLSAPRFVARFYEKNMVSPAFGWEDRSEYQNEGDRVLKFTKGRSVCTIVITETRSPAIRTRIEIDIVSTA